MRKRLCRPVEVSHPHYNFDRPCRCNNQIQRLTMAVLS